MERSEAVLRDGLPVRLIDAISTINNEEGRICFKAAEGWDFHVISHTWSQDVRDLSTEIGNFIGDACQEGPDAYNEAFKERDFSSVACYKQLRSFLQLLVADGVCSIWFDALCINQTDEDEKSREIRNMAAYYGQSRGCYVLSHGLGKGYELWVKKVDDGKLEIPRWFTRVWTYQEFLLPQNLSFLVEGLDERFMTLLNWVVMEESKVGLCKCFLGRPRDGSDKGLWGSSQSPYWTPRTFNRVRNVTKDDLNLQIGDKEELKSAVEKMVSSNIPCDYCHSFPMIRKTQELQTYFVDREAYLGVVQAHSCYMKYEKHMEEYLSPEGFFLSPEGTIRSLYNTFLRKRYRIWDVMTEIRKRECSRDEDRVLSVLGLLGVQMSQLRTGKSLEEQLVEVVKVCTPQMVAELCAMEGKACHTVGISWAPDLRPSDYDDEFWMSHGDYVFLPHLMHTHSLQVSAATGPIKLFPMKVLSGLVCRTPASSSAAIAVQSDATTSKSSLHHLGCRIPLDFKPVASSYDGRLMLNFKFDEECGFGQFQVPINRTHLGLIPDLHHMDVSFHVHMVHLGGALDAFETLYHLIMVCLNNSNTTGKEEEGQELHKIGMFYLRDSVSEESEDEWDNRFEKRSGRNFEKLAQNMDMMMKMFDAAKPRECTIGGFGPDLSRYVNVERDIKPFLCAF